jgi:hypothetical protein
MKLRFVLSAAIVAVSSALVTYIAVAAPFAQPKTTVATQLSYQSTSYTVAAGATQSEILVPVTNRPIHMMVAMTDASDRGLGSVTIMRAARSGGTNILAWVGVDMASNTSSSYVNEGSGLQKGMHVMYADLAAQLDVQIQNDSHLQLVNTGPTPMTVVVTFMY